MLDYFDSYQRGEEKGFNHYFRKWHSWLRGYAYGFVKDSDVAEELITTSWTNLWRKRIELKFECEAVLGSYIKSTVRNACLNHINAIKRNRDKRQELDEGAYIEDSYSVEEELIKAETYQMLQDYIEVLPIECRKIFSLLKSGYTVKEISEFLGKAISTIKNQKKIGIDKIRSLVGSKPEVKEEHPDRNINPAYISKRLSAAGITFTIPSNVTIDSLHRSDLHAKKWFFNFVYNNTPAWIKALKNEKSFCPYDIFGEAALSAWDQAEEFTSISDMILWTYERGGAILREWEGYPSTKRRKNKSLIWWNPMSDGVFLNGISEKSLFSVSKELPTRWKFYLHTYIENNFRVAREDDNFLRNVRYAFSEINNRLYFYRHSAINDATLDKLRKLLQSLPKNRRKMIGDFINGKTMADISKEKGIQWIGLRHVVCSILAKIKRIYPHPSLMLYKEPMENKISNFFSSTDSGTLRVIEMIKADVLTFQGRKRVYKTKQKLDWDAIMAELNKGVKTMKVVKMFNTNKSTVLYIRKNYKFIYA